MINVEEKYCLKHDVLRGRENNKYQLYNFLEYVWVGELKINMKN